MKTLFQINATRDQWLIQQSAWQLDRWSNFLWKAKKVAEKQNDAVEFDRVWVRYKDEETGEAKEERRYYFSAKGLKEKEAKKLEAKVFAEATRWLFGQNKSFNKNDRINIDDRDGEELYLILSEDLRANPVLEAETMKIELRKKEIRSLGQANDLGFFGEVLEGKCQAWLKPDTYQLDRQIEALNTLKICPLNHHLPLLRLFGPKDHDDWHKESGYENVEDWIVLNDPDFDGVEEQRNFVELALSSPDFALLEGPPGSGKTTTIIELILQLIRRGKRILLCSATHVAIDNVISRMIDPNKYKEHCEDYVVPVRISLDTFSVDDAVKPYLMQNLIKTKKKEILSQLRKDHRNGSQAYLLKNLDEDRKDDRIAKLILDSANLVAGTTIGILNHPDIRSGRMLQAFDVLIVDEASKVTFQEFLVPAIHAAKWILVGDIQQLSPYVEGDYVSENLCTLIENPLKRKFLVDCFAARLNRLRNSKDLAVQVIFSNAAEDSVLSSLEEEGDVFQTTDGQLSGLQEHVQINAADFLILPHSSSAMTKALRSLDVKAEFHQMKIPNSAFRYRQDRLHRHRHGVGNYESLEEETWEDLLARMLEIQYGYRSDPKKYTEARNEANLLIPDDIADRVSIIERVAYPSIMELLQRGVGENRNQRTETVFTHGLSPDAKSFRFETLTYQHRMHEDIAKCSRIHFYNGDRLLTSSFVRERPAFQYRTNEDAVVWVHNNDNTGRGSGSIVNPTEVEDIRHELESLAQFSQTGSWSEGKILEVAVLTFYKNQESKLRQMLQKFAQSPRANRNFRKGNLKITLCTVDKFQGNEADVVLLSFTKSSRGAHYHSPNRLNVALTRARFKLILFGNRVWMMDRARMKALNFLGTEFKSRIINRGGKNVKA